MFSTQISDDPGMPIAVATLVTEVCNGDLPAVLVLAWFDPTV